MSDEEYDKFGQELETVQRDMKNKSFPVGQVSGWDDDAEGIEEERNPVGKFSCVMNCQLRWLQLGSCVRIKNAHVLVCQRFGHHVLCFYL
jgi:hypothetical protein